MGNITIPTYLTGSEEIDGVDWQAGVVLPVNKPFEWTSFDVVNKLRYRLKHLTGHKKFKVGHAGTLDPRATGLLLIACGKATKQIEQLTIENKEYSGVIRLGATTPTFDGEMPPDREYQTEHIHEDMIKEAQKEFTGVMDQRPPVYSAIKKDGKRLYQYARKGQAVEVPVRKIEIHDLSLKWDGGLEIAFDCVCSKGTYIRSLANDIGKFLDSGAYLKELTRTSIGDYSLKEAWKLEELIEAMERQIESEHVDKS